MIVLLAVVLFIAPASTWADLLPKSGDDSVTKLRHDLFEILDDQWGDISDPRWLAAIKKQNSEPGQEILQGIAEFGNELETVTSTLGLQKSIDAAKLFLSPIWLWAQVEEHLLTVDGLYKTLRTLEKRSSFEQRQWTDFADTTLQNTAPSVRSALQRLHELTTIQDEGGLFKKVPKVLEV
jgi:hypothetical protein